MDWINILVVFFSSIAVSISTYFLQKGNTNVIQKNLDGNYVLRLPKMYKYMGIGSIIILSFYVILALVHQDRLSIVMLISRGNSFELHYTGNPQLHMSVTQDIYHYH